MQNSELEDLTNKFIDGIFALVELSNLSHKDQYRSMKIMVLRPDIKESLRGLVDGGKDPKGIITQVLTINSKTNLDEIEKMLHSFTRELLT